MKKIRITIGTGCGLRKDGSIISLADRIKMIGRVKQHLLAACSGYTMIGADGGWRDADGKDWEEPNLQFVTTVEPGAGQSDIFLSDGTYLMDGALKLDGNTLRSHEQKGFIRVGGLVRLTLGPVSFAKVQALRIGESATL